jgi:hypothetical protein
MKKMKIEARRRRSLTSNEGADITTTSFYDYSPHSPLFVSHPRRELESSTYEKELESGAMCVQGAMSMLARVFEAYVEPEVNWCVCVCDGFLFLTHLYMATFSSLSFLKFFNIFNFILFFFFQPCMYLQLGLLKNI